ncbi:MAG: hypothetical protein Q8L92_10795, partial [Rubrivivax sp.]|nr:hypothetical protein [Rubrivivax sp.]
LQAVRDCDVLIVLSNGNAGWAKTGGDIGICHAEYAEGLALARGKVRLIALPRVPLAKGNQGARDQRFRDELNRQTAFRGGEVDTVDDLRKRVFEALADAVVVLTQRGVKSSASSRFGMGQALDWTRLDFSARKREMEQVVRTALSSQPGATASGNDVVLPLGGKDIGVIVHAIPAAFTVAAAREMVGRPFLRDHERTDLLKKAQGPLHLIACHRGATETQARALLGFPDAIVVSDIFGIYVADQVQKVQFAFLANCRDDSQTRHALQRFLEWLEQSAEAQRLAARAQSRANIVRAIAAENKNK